MTLRGGDEVISLSILNGKLPSVEAREEYLRVAPWKADDGAPALTEEHARMAEEEEFVLTVCANGYGKLSSAYEYRQTGRGGQGVLNIDNIRRNGPVVASFRATKADQLMLVTDKAKLIRISLESLRVIGRNSAGVRLFDVGKDEHVVAAVKIDEEEGPENEAEEMVVEEMLRSGGAVTEPETTLDRDDNLEEDENGD
jgi:DNA gyrase subunit A